MGNALARAIIVMCVEFVGHFNELKTEKSFIILANNYNISMSSPIKTTHYGAGASAASAVYFVCNNNIYLLLRKFSHATFKVEAVKLI